MPDPTTSTTVKDIVVHTTVRMVQVQQHGWFEWFELVGRILFFVVIGLVFWSAGLARARRHDT